jgi:steroid 5-alpha reductase family enzyme
VGARLPAHIYLRNRGQGEDKRYASLLRRNMGSPARFALRYIYWTQGRVMWFVSLPLQVAMYERASLGIVTWLGVAVWAVGFGFETMVTGSCGGGGGGLRRRARAMLLQTLAVKRTAWGCV